VLNTHLGLAPHEQRAQAKALMGPDWIGARGSDAPPLILLGDFNATPYAATYRTLAQGLKDARACAGRPTPTFPSRFPMLAIDHVFLDGDIEPQRVEVMTAPLARIASDHLPLIVDFRFR
jgi:endonuclease/exonuclease/phosphatase family metal-dependent hydrolase